MFARVTTTQSSADHFDDVVRRHRETIVPFMMRQDGCRGVHLLADEATGRVLTLSLWETEDAMRASEDMAGLLRTQSRMAGNSTERVDRYQVIDWSDA